MNEYQKKISTTIYLILGTIFTVGGFDTLFENPLVCLPINNVDYNSVYYFIEICQGILHLFMDLSATYMIIGTLLMWASVNYERAKGLDYFLLTFFFFSSITHWVESFNLERNVSSPIIALVPLILISVIIVLRKIEEYNKHIH